MHFSKFHARFCGPTSEPVFRAGFLIPLIIAGLEVRPLSGRIFEPAFICFFAVFCIFRCASVQVFGQVWHGCVAVGNGLVLGVHRCGAEHSSRLKDQAENTTNGLTRIGPKRRPSSTVEQRVDHLFRFRSARENTTWSTLSSRKLRSEGPYLSMRFTASIAHRNGGTYLFGWKFT